MVRVTESWHWPLTSVAWRSDGLLLHDSTTLLEDEMVVVLVHLSDVVLHQLIVCQVFRVFVRVCRVHIRKLLSKLSELLLRLDRVEDRSTN